MEPDQPFLRAFQDVAGFEAVLSVQGVNDVAELVRYGADEMDRMFPAFAVFQHMPLVEIDKGIFNNILHHVVPALLDQELDGFH